MLKSRSHAAQFRQALALFAIFGHPIRVVMFQRLAKTPMTAGELAKTGKVPDAAKLYQGLADRPTVSVPRASALLALADAYRSGQPAQARQIYDRLGKEFASNTAIAQAVKQQMATLTP